MFRIFPILSHGSPSLLVSPLLELSQIRTLSTACANLGINKYRTPVREIILNNEKAKDELKVQRENVGVKDPNAEKVEIFYKNQNPRHLDLQGYNKPSGFTTLHENRNFYNKLHLELTNRHTKAYVENVNGDIICYASTTEFYIAKHLHSTTDVSAVVNIARILSDRLKQIGMPRVSWYTRLDRTTEKIREFEGILRMNGILLTEAPSRVLEGPSLTLPPPRAKRVFPGALKTGAKRRGTINRKDKD